MGIGRINPRLLFALATALAMTLCLAAFGVAPSSAHPFGDNDGAAGVVNVAGVRDPYINGIAATVTVPVDRIDVVVYCNGAYRVYVVVPSNCRSNSLVRTGGNLRPMQIIAQAGLEATREGDTVAVGFGAGCFSVENDCSGFGSNGQMYKRAYVDGYNNGFYYFSWYNILNMGSQHRLEIKRVWYGDFVWIHYLDDVQIATTHQGNRMTNGVAVYGVESSGVNNLDMTMQHWSYLARRHPNEPYVAATEINVDQPHNPACGETYIAYYGVIEGFGRC